ncbi:Cof-type HAD-IIB family hydrolase [Pediococcus ethanolidurans]|nr:Cof-type HAD-IIB family hydrolase [Pediococcus ethanolidurans]MBU7555475.1 HAD family phosphatase [Pediococcus ethanolidurans]MBU7563829.1 HAD family phosphatase [Pediococcus ethanolidurans]MCV3315242.1 Cof-type HAD-IIB family hydrolase [Pediococcus ethanolidurans]MCV3321469.1 Cof-type HAD-IIB family hydrolase [Pediococcus ethanolidurans]MCV3323443.1 Cof-type HAD-IIB family hydrolase [Pediococcus ethanolidurans]
MIKMIALDLDNTLLNADKKISEANTQILKKLHKQGKEIVLCTGRPINAIWDWLTQLGLMGENDYSVNFNGSLVIRNVDKKPLMADGMKRAHFGDLHKFCLANEYPLDILDFSGVYPINDLPLSGYEKRLGGNMHFLHVPFAKLPAVDYSKAVICTEPATLDHIVTHMPAQLKQEFHIVRSQPMILEFLKPGIDKGSALDVLLKHFEWTRDNLMTFGDAQNDLEMLASAGVGVAMANGTPEAKQTANQVTAVDNDHDGVANFLTTYFAANN